MYILFKFDHFQKQIIFRDELEVIEKSLTVVQMRKSDMLSRFIHVV